ncbi:MAG TPA: hypothetical protein VG652_07660 [Gaiellaceae bacterium]|nr:hypothetical protein [Gaiellaceae bacterium]
MLEISEAMARAALQRVGALRNERLTRDAQQLLQMIDAPVKRLGTISKTPERYSPQAHLRERCDLERAYLLMRQDRREAVVEARKLLADCLRRNGPLSREPYLDGDTRLGFLSDLAAAFSQVGQEIEAIATSLYLLQEMGVPAEISQISEVVLSDPILRGRKSRIVTQLNNLSVRRMKLAYLSAFEGDTASAVEGLARGRREAEEALKLRDAGDSPRATTARLLSRSNLARIVFEQAALIEDLDDRGEALRESRDDLTAILKDSYELATIRPRARLIRAAVLGMLMLEQARVSEVQGDRPTATALAWTARVGMKPMMDFFVEDADEAHGRAIRYGDACRLTGDRRRASLTWARARDRIALFRGPDSPAIATLEARIDELRE